jgi:predicted acyl esterase
LIGRVRAAPWGDMVLESRAMVPMRDGVRLATDIYQPTRNGQAIDGRIAVILEAKLNALEQSADEAVGRVSTQSRTW